MNYSDLQIGNKKQYLYANYILQTLIDSQKIKVKHPDLTIFPISLDYFEQFCYKEMDKNIKKKVEKKVETKAKCTKMPVKLIHVDEENVCKLLFLQYKKKQANLQSSNLNH